MVEVQPYRKNYIGGAWGDGGAGRIAVTNPATSEKLAKQALADAADGTLLLWPRRPCICLAR